MAEKNIEIGGRLHSIATGNVLAGANEIFDDDKNKKQSDINTETYTLVNDVNERLNSLSPDQQSALTVAAKATNNETKLGYYVCGTEGNVAAKVISNATGYILSKGGSMKVKMTNANTAANATLNINSTGAKPLYYDGERASTNNSWEAGETVEVYYDGTNYYANNVAGGSGSGDGAFDISAKTGQNYETLTAALTAANTILPASKKKGGMSIKFIQLTPATYSVVKTEGLTEQPTGTEVQEALVVGTGSYTAAQLSGITLPSAVGGSVTYWMAVTVDELTTYTTWVITKVTSDKTEYVQYRLMKTTWSRGVADWQGVDSEPVVGSRSLVESGGVFTQLRKITGGTANYGVGKYVNSAGTLSNNDSYGYTSFIPCEAGDTVSFSPGGNTSYGGACFCFYDENKSFLKYYTANELPRTVIAPANTAFVRGSIYLPSIDNSFCIINNIVVWRHLESEEGLIPDVVDNLESDSSKSALSANQGRILDTRKSINVIGNNTEIVGKVFEGLLQKGHKYKIHLLNKDFDTSGDTLTTLHERLTIEYVADSVIHNIITVYSNGTLADNYFFKLSEEINGIIKLRIKIRATLGEVVHFLLEDVTKDIVIDDFLNNFSKNPVENGVVKGAFDSIVGRQANYHNGRFVVSDGEISSPNAKYGYSDFIPCEAGDTLTWAAGDVYEGICFCFYNEDKEFIVYKACNANPRTVTVPANSKYVRGSYFVANINDAYCIINDSLIWKPQDGIDGMVNVIDNLDSESATASLSANQGKLLDRIRSLYVIGNNTTIVYKYFTGVIVGGHRYRIHLLNKDFDISGDTLTTGHERLHFGYKVKGAETETQIAVIQSVSTLADYYDFTAGNYGDILEYFRISLRATKDEKVHFAVEDISCYDDSFNLEGVDKTSVEEKTLEFTDLFQNAGNDIQSFVFFTDPHLFNNVNAFNSYILNIQKYYRNTPTDFVLCGGDWLQSDDSVSQAINRLAKVDAVCRRMLAPYYPMLGNHDTNYQGTEELSSTVITNLWFREYGKAYYSFVNTNTRYYVFDTDKDNDHSMSSYRTEQLTWLADSLIQNTDEHIILCFHIYYYNSTNIETFAQRLIDIASAYNNRSTFTVDGVTKDFSSSTGKVHAAIVGHSHRDFVVYNKGIPVIGTVNTQKEGTPSYDLVLIDYTNDVINMVRIGFGENRTINMTEE